MKLAGYGILGGRGCISLLLYVAHKRLRFGQLICVISVSVGSLAVFFVFLTKAFGLDPLISLFWD